MPRRPIAWYLPCAMASFVAACGGRTERGADAGIRDTVVIFTATAGSPHVAAAATIATVEVESATLGLRIETAADVTTLIQSLPRALAVVLPQTSGDVFDDATQDALEDYVRAGGGIVAVHAALGLEPGWPFAQTLLGARSTGSTTPSTATVRVERALHEGTVPFGSLRSMSMSEAFLGLTTDPRPTSVVLLSVDDASFSAGATAMPGHPVAWTRRIGSGRVAFTGLASTEARASDPVVGAHLRGLVAWASALPATFEIVHHLEGGPDTGTWRRLQLPAPFAYSVGIDALSITDETGQNQHLGLDAPRLMAGEPYGIEALFRLAPGADGLNSFCLLLGLDAERVAADRVSTWAVNVDVGAADGSGITKHMGFVEGAFASIGETALPFARKDVEYLLRAEVNVDAAGVHAPGRVTVTVSDAGAEASRFSVDYATFPLQLAPDRSVQVGVNAHGTSVVLRSFRVYRADRAP